MNKQKDLEYKETLTLIIKTIELSQVKVMVAANSQMLWAYWNIGKILQQKSQELKWGAKVIDNLSKDIRSKLPEAKGFSPRNLLYMRQFAQAYPHELVLMLTNLWERLLENPQQAVAQIQRLQTDTSQITQQAVAQFEEKDFTESLLAKVTWSHHVVLMDKCPNFAARFWYICNCIEHGVSRNILLMQIESGLFDRQVRKNKITNFSATLPKPQSDFAKYLLKDPYIFDFVQATERANELDIETQLTQHITKFLLELGQGFSFVGRQYHLRVGGEDYYIDLLFYHTKLHCYVVVELKARSFEPGDPAKLNFYINVVNDYLKTEHDNDTIGLLLCKGKNEVVAEYALQGYLKPIGVADYQLSKAIPEGLKSTLPNIDELEKELEQIKTEDNN